MHTYRPYQINAKCAKSSNQEINGMNAFWHSPSMNTLWHSPPTEQV